MLRKERGDTSAPYVCPFALLLLAAELFGRRDVQYPAAAGEVSFQSRDFTARLVIHLARDFALLLIFTGGQNGPTGLRIVGETVPRIIAALGADIQNHRFGFPYL